MYCPRGLLQRVKELRFHLALLIVKSFPSVSKLHLVMLVSFGDKTVCASSRDRIVLFVGVYYQFWHLLFLAYCLHSPETFL